MKKEDFFKCVDERLRGLSLPEWQAKAITLTHPFDWNFLNSIADTAGRVDHMWYCYYYASLLPDNSTIVEIGTYEGGSSIAMATAIRGKNSIIITIDPGLLSDEEKKERQKEFEKHDPIKGDLHWFMKCIRRGNAEGCILPIPGTSEEVLKRWSGRKIDMLYVDGSHKYEDVKIDCQWMQYIRHGGVAIFDDWMEPVERAVREYLHDKSEWELLTSSTDQALDRPWKTVFWRN